MAPGKRGGLLDCPALRGGGGPVLIQAFLLFRDVRIERPCPFRTVTTNCLEWAGPCCTGFSVVSIISPMFHLMMQLCVPVQKWNAAPAFSSDAGQGAERSGDWVVCGHEHAVLRLRSASGRHGPPGSWTPMWSWPSQRGIITRWFGKWNERRAAYQQPSSACRKTSTRFSKMQAFFRGDAGLCAHSLSLAHLRPGKCVFRRTRRRKTRFDPLPPSADGGTLRGSCSINRRNILY